MFIHIWVIPAQMYNFFHRSQNFGQKPPESSKGSILTWNMAFKSDLGPFLVLREANFDRGVQKVDFSIFKFFFTFFFVKHHHVGHFANPIWQIKGRGLFEDHERVGLSRKFEQSNRRLLTAYLLLYRSVEAYKLLNLPLNCWKMLKKSIQKLFWRWFWVEKRPYVIQSSILKNEIIVFCPASH